MALVTVLVGNVILIFGNAYLASAFSSPTMVDALLFCMIFSVATSGILMLTGAANENYGVALGGALLIGAGAFWAKAWTNSPFPSSCTTTKTATTVEGLVALGVVTVVVGIILWVINGELEQFNVCRDED